MPDEEDKKELSITESEIQNKSLQEIFAKDMIKNPNKKDGFNNIAELFKIMSASYGDNWNRQYNSDTVRDVWAIVLWEKDKSTILEAIKIAFLEYKKFPPNLVEFTEICEKIESHDNKKSKVEQLYNRLK